jgi:hypothetical protein
MRKPLIIAIIVSGSLVLIAGATGVVLLGFATVSDLGSEFSSDIDPTKQNIAEFHGVVDPIPDLHVEDIHGWNDWPFHAVMYTTLSVDPMTSNDRISAIVDIIGRFLNDQIDSSGGWSPVTLKAGDFALEITDNRGANSASLAKFEIERTATPATPLGSSSNRLNGQDLAAFVGFAGGWGAVADAGDAGDAGAAGVTAVGEALPASAEYDAARAAN